MDQTQEDNFSMKTGEKNAISWRVNGFGGQFIMIYQKLGLSSEKDIQMK